MSERVIAAYADQDGSVDAIAARVADRQLLRPTSQQERERQRERQRESERRATSRDAPLRSGHQVTEVTPHAPHLGFMYDEPANAESTDFELVPRGGKLRTFSESLDSSKVANERPQSLSLSCPTCRAPSMSQTPATCSRTDTGQGSSEGSVFCLGCQEVKVCARQGSCTPIVKVSA